MCRILGKIFKIWQGIRNKNVANAADHTRETMNATKEKLETRVQKKKIDQRQFPKGKEGTTMPERMRRQMCQVDHPLELRKALIPRPNLGGNGPEKHLKDDLRRPQPLNPNGDGKWWNWVLVARYRAQPSLVDNWTPECTPSPWSVVVKLYTDRHQDIREATGISWQEAIQTPDLDLYHVEAGCTGHQDFALSATGIMPTRTIRVWNPEFRHSDVKPINGCCWAVDVHIRHASIPWLKKANLSELVRPENNLGFTMFEDVGHASQSKLKAVFELDGPSGQYWRSPVMEHGLDEWLGDHVWNIVH